MPANAIIQEFNPPRPARVSRKLNIRSDVTLRAGLIGRLEPNEAVDVAASLEGDSFEGQKLWYRLTGGESFVWSGGIALGFAPPAPQPAGPAPVVQTRPDGTIKPFTVPQLSKVFGAFMSKPAEKRGFIEIEPAWVADNIVSLTVPVLQPLGFTVIRVHHLAAPHFKAVFDEIEHRGLDEDLLSCGGTFVPRHISQDPLKALSSHSWGIAIDLNVAWNGYGQRPALLEEQGTVRRILPIFNAHGFAWGGHFSTGPDGMHFELARTDL